MLKKYFLLLTTCYSLLAIIGCSKNPLAPAGTVSFGAETKSTIGGAPAFWTSMPPPSSSEFEVTVAKIEISESGDEWTEVHKGDSATIVKGNLEVVAGGKPVASTDYEGVRVWFGKNLKVNDLYGNTAEWNDFDKDNPVVFSTRNGKLSYPFAIERNTECFIVFQFNFTGVGAPALAPTSGYFFRPSITVRVSRFK